MKQFLLPVLFFVSAYTNAQQFNNLDFHQTCDSSKTGLCYWDLSWGMKGAVRPDEVDKKAMLIEGEKENSVGWAEQTSLINQRKDISILTVSAYISTENVEGKGAGINVGLYDKDDKLIATKDMGGFYSVDWVRGSTPWKHYSVSLICPVTAAKMKIGAILYGKGKARFRTYKIMFMSTEKRKASPLAVQYISSACDTIKKYSLFRDSFDIKDAKNIALRIAGPSKSYNECYLAVEYLLERLRPYGDEHSFFMTANEVSNWEKNGSLVNKIQFPTYKVIDSCGYILVPPFHGGNHDIILAFADSLQYAIQTLAGSGIKGWIIDLRQNTGGNMEPMIAGLGPLFSSDKLGSLINVENKPDNWYYKNGKYYGDSYSGFSVTKPCMIAKQLPIAVLTSNQTGSSGEIVAISFIGNAKTRSFGQPTWGLTTGNGEFKLEDGSKMYLASTIMADRNGKLYRASVSPDVILGESVVHPDRLIMAVAVDWINSQK
jgi:carboxyl-terminal processing protease